MVTQGSIAADTATKDNDLLARRANCGDARAAGALLDRHWSRLRNAAQAIAGRTSDAEELLASALASTWEKWKRGEGPTHNVHGYITQAMRNRLFDDARSPHARTLSLETRSSHPLWTDDLRHIDNAARNATLWDAVDQLPEIQRDVLMKIIVEGRKPRDLKDELGIPASTVSTLLYRGKQQLHKRLFPLWLTGILR